MVHVITDASMHAWGSGLGCVIYTQGSIVSVTGMTTERRAPHAEVAAIMLATKHLIDLGITDCCIWTDCLAAAQVLHAVKRHHMRGTTATRALLAKHRITVKVTDRVHVAEAHMLARLAARNIPR